MASLFDFPLLSTERAADARAITSATLVAKLDGVPKAEVPIKPAAPLGAVWAHPVPAGPTDLFVRRDLRSALGQQLRSNSKASRALLAELDLRVVDAGGEERILKLGSWGTGRTLEFKLLTFLTPLRFLSPAFLTHTCVTALKPSATNLR